VEVTLCGPLLARNNSLHTDGAGAVLSFTILATIPFDSTRKRMSVIVQYAGSEGGIVLSKGADNVMLDRAVDFMAGEYNIIDIHYVPAHMLSQ
jgi:magnesium-transporting ATPase (P-type)